MNQSAYRIAAMRRYDQDATIHALLDAETTFEAIVCELLSYIQEGRLVIARGVGPEVREQIGSTVKLASLAIEGRYRNTYERQPDGSFLIRARRNQP